MAAVSLPEAHDVSDLCIGKPALRWLPPSSTVADAIAKLDGPDASAVAVWDGKGAVEERVCMADVILFLCYCGNLASPAAALEATLSDLLLASAAGATRVRRIEPDASVLEAVDALLDGARSLVVPIRDRWRTAAADGGMHLCWLTVENLVRFFLGSIAFFSPTASLSVSDLGVVRPTIGVEAGDSALSALRLLRTALSTHASVAVVSSGIYPRLIVGEISTSILFSCDAFAAAGFAVRSRLCGRNLLGMLDLLDPSPPSSSCSSFSASSSSEDEEEDDHDDDGKGKTLHPARRTTILGGRRRVAAEAIVACHRGSSLVAVMVQAITHRVTQVWVVDEDELVGAVGFLDVLRVLRRHLLQRV